METVVVREQREGEVLVRTRFLSVDPYMRGRIAPGKNYAASVAPGDLMVGGGVGEVIASRHPLWKAGDIAEAMTFGWQNWAAQRPDLPGTAAVSQRLSPSQCATASSSQARRLRRRRAADQGSHRQR